MKKKKERRWKIIIVRMLIMLFFVITATNQVIKSSSVVRGKQSKRVIRILEENIKIEVELKMTTKFKGIIKVTNPVSHQLVVVGTKELLLIRVKVLQTLIKVIYGALILVV